MRVANSKSVKTIDLHNLTVIEAKNRLTSFIRNLDNNVLEVLVIHGFNNGEAIKKMIINDFHSPRVMSKVPSLNNSGSTRLLLRSK